MNFYPRSPCGERLPEGVKGKAHHSGFLSTLSLRRATLRKFRWVLLVGNFYPRSPCGERPRIFLDLTFHKNFYPRSPCGERRRPDKLQLPQNHFYPRSPCGERPALSLPFGAVWIISIHALLAESDYRDCVRGLIWRISIHALLAESDAAVLGTVPDVAHFYPRSPCGERLDMSSAYPAVQCISIHALLAESDQT